MHAEHPYRFGNRLTGGHSAQTILFLHGFMGNKDDWSGIAGRLIDFYPTVSLDLPGHGETRVEDDSLYRMENCAAGLVRFIDELGIGDCHVAGYSMGGRLALYLAVNYPERFRSFIIESASPGLKTSVERAERVKHDESLARKLETVEFESFLREWYNAPLFSSLRQCDRFESLIERRTANDPLGLAKSLRNMGTGMQPSLWQRLDQIKAPTMLIAGALDAKFSGIASEMSLLNTNIQTRIIEKTGHNVHFELPEIYSEHVKLFLARNT